MFQLSFKKINPIILMVFVISSCSSSSIEQKIKLKSKLNGFENSKKITSIDISNVSENRKSKTKDGLKQKETIEDYKKVFVIELPQNLNNETDKDNIIIFNDLNIEEDSVFSSVEEIDKTNKIQNLNNETGEDSIAIFNNLNIVEDFVSVEQTDQTNKIQNLNIETAKDSIAPHRDLGIEEEISIFGSVEEIDKTNQETVLAALKMLKEKRNVFKKENNKNNTLKTIQKNKEEVWSNKGEFSKNVKIKIALLLPLTGKNKIIGQEILKGIELSMFNSPTEGLEVIVFDTQKNYLKTLQQIKKMKVNLILGPVFSSELSKAKKTINFQSTPILSFSNNSRLKDKNIWILGEFPDEEAKHIIRFGITTGIKNVAILGTDNQFGRILSDAAEEELSQIGGALNITLFDSDIINNRNKLREKIKIFSGWTRNNNNKSKLPKAKYDAIFLAGNENFILKVMPLLAYYDFGSDRTMILGTSQMNRTKIVNEPSLGGAFFSSNQEQLKEIFVTKWRDVWGGNPSRMAGLGFDVIKASSNYIDKETFLEYFTNKEGHDWVTGKAWFTNDGGNRRNLKVNRIIDNKITTVFVN